MNVQKLVCSPHSDWSTMRDQIGGSRRRKLSDLGQARWDPR